MPEPKDFTSVSFYQYLSEQKLMGSRCGKCGNLLLPPRQICPSCHSQDMEWFIFKGTGKLVAFTTIAVCLTQMETEGFGRDNPYCTGVVEVDEGPRISGRILGVDAKHPETIKVGSKVQARFLNRGDEKESLPQLNFEVIE